MKTKKNSTAKLSLKKEKITVLNQDQLNNLVGGNAGENTGGSKGDTVIYTSLCTAN